MIENISFDKANDLVEINLCQDRSIKMSFQEASEFSRKLIEFLKTGQAPSNTITLNSTGLALRRAPTPMSESQILPCNPYIKVLDEQQLLSNDQNTTGS